MRTWYADNKVLARLIASCIIAAVLGAALIAMSIANRPQLSDADKDRATSHCVKWLSEYTKAPNPIIRCQDAAKKDPDSFYTLWAPER